VILKQQKRSPLSTVLEAENMPGAMFDFDAVVIGSGFGGTIAALTLGREFKNRNRGETVHILERGPGGRLPSVRWRTPSKDV